MKQTLMNLIIYGGALLLCPTHSRAEPYTLLYSLVPSAQGVNHQYSVRWVE